MKRGTALPKSKNLGKICLSCFAFVFAVLGGSTAFAMDPLGAPIATLEPGQVQLGFDYSRSTMDFLLKKGEFISYENSFTFETGKAFSVTINDFERNSSYVNFGYGVDYNWDVFIRLSSTQAEFGDSLLNQAEEFESDSVPAFGGGIKATFYDGDYLKVGGLIQANWAHYNGQLNSPLWELPQFIEANITEIQMTIGASYMWIDGIWLYGGPLVHFISGEFEDTLIKEGETSYFFRSETSWDIEGDTTYGGYIGTQVDIGEDCSLSIEYQLTEAADALGASIVFRF